MTDDARGELIPDNYNLNAAIADELRDMQQSGRGENGRPTEASTGARLCNVRKVESSEVTPLLSEGPLSQLWDGRAEAEWRARVEAANWPPEEATWRKEAEQRLAKVLRDINGGNLPGYGGL